MLQTDTTCYNQLHADTKTKRMSSNFRMEKTCEHCNEAFIAKTLHTRFCGHPCAQKNYKKRKREAKIQSVTKPAESRANSNHDPPDLNKEIFTINEACQFLSISRMTLHRLIKNRMIPSFKIGNRRFIKKEEILLMIKIYERNEN